MDFRYDLGEGHALLGRRVPDQELAVAGLPRQLYAFLHDGSALLIGFDSGALAEAPHWEGRLRVINASYAGQWEIPVVGPIPAPSALLVRPEGYVAWAAGVPPA